MEGLQEDLINKVRAELPPQEARKVITELEEIAALPDGTFEIVTLLTELVNEMFKKNVSIDALSKGIRLQLEDEQKGLRTLSVAVAMIQAAIEPED